MKELFENYGILYFVFISVIAVLVTGYDKVIACVNGGIGSNKSKDNKGSNKRDRCKKTQVRRISENNLILLACLGGSVFMYIFMKVIRHKTKHKKFMIGIPVIIAVQVIVIILLWKFA